MRKVKSVSFSKKGQMLKVVEGDGGISLMTRNEVIGFIVYGTTYKDKEKGQCLLSWKPFGEVLNLDAIFTKEQKASIARWI